MPPRSNSADRLNKVFSCAASGQRGENVSAYRVYDADLPDYNMAIDLYEGAGEGCGQALVHVAEYAPPKSIDADKAARRMTDALNIASAVFDVPATDVFVKRRVRSKGGSQYARDLRDETTSPGAAVSSRSRKRPALRGRPRELPRHGIVLDHRDTRELVGKLAKGKSFLNLFAYTCTASVLCGCPRGEVHDERRSRIRTCDGASKTWSSTVS